MELFDAIESRCSIRAFKSNSVPMEVIFDLLRLSTRSPSGVNCQPWELFIVTGSPLKRLTQAYVEQFRKGAKSTPEIYEGQDRKGVAPSLKGVYRERQVRLGKQMFQLLGIKKGDDAKLQQYYESMYRFYDAPTAIIIAADKSLLVPSVSLDVGLLTQTIALAAQGYELGTCIMRAIVDYPDIARDITKIPQSKRLITGIAVGYPDWDAPINRFKTEREDLENIVTVVTE